MFKRIILSLLEHIFYIGILIGSILIIFGNQITAHIARSTTQHTVVKKISQDDLKKENEKADYDWSTRTSLTHYQLKCKVNRTRLRF